MTASWAYIYEHPETDPVADRTVIERAGQRTLLVPVSSSAEAPGVARRLVDEDGVGLVELCGGFSLVDAARVAEELAGDVPVGHVTFAVDSTKAVTEYAQRFEAATSYSAG